MRSKPLLPNSSVKTTISTSSSRSLAASSSLMPYQLAAISRAPSARVNSGHAFARSALFNAVTSVLVGFTIASANAAETRFTETKPVTTSNTTAASTAATESTDDTVIDFDSDAKLDEALEALRLRKAFEQGEIDKSVLDDYSQQSKDKNNNASNNKSNKAEKSSNGLADPKDDNWDDDRDINHTERFESDLALQQQATAIQQQGYQMMTPEQIERELAALDADNNAFMDSAFDSSQNDNFDTSFNDNFNDNFDASFNDSVDSLASGDGFNAPIARLDSQQLPIGLDPKLDAAILPAPNNLETLNSEQTAQQRADTAEIMSRPIEVSDAVSSGRVDDSANILQNDNPEKILAAKSNSSVTGAGTNNAISTIAEAKQQASSEERLEEQNGELNPEDYLPDYQATSDTEAVAEGVTQASKPKPLARNEGGIVKRLYNRFFNGGVAALPKVETTVYLQQAATTNSANRMPKLIKADEDIQPIDNIKAALDDTTVQSVADFTAALPRLRETALNAAKAVGYYDITLKLRQPDANSIDVIIEKLGEPVKVESRIVDVRGEGSEQEEFKALEKSALPAEGDVFNHRVYKNSKAAFEALSSTYGYFDEKWLNKSVDIILPDNTADISLVYDTGERYDFDEVVFFTYDEASNTLTRDPDKLPVELSLLRQLLNFEAGDPFYRPDVTKLSNDLSATRYFNTVNVESILPPDERSASSTLAFDNAPSAGENVADNELDNDVTNGSVNGNGSTMSGANRNNNSNTNNINNNLNPESRDSSGDGTAANGVSAEGINANSGAKVDAADIAPIEFQVDEETQSKLQAVKDKANRLSRLPNDRVLDEKKKKSENFLGKISDSISNIAQKIFPEEERVIDENFVPPTLANRITPEQVLVDKKVPLYVFVSADKPRDAQVGLGYGTDTGVRATAKIDYNLVNRKGYQAGAEVEASRISKNVTVYGSRPWKHPLNDKLEARLTYEEEVIDQGEGNFDLSTNTLKAALARNIRKESGWNKSYSLRYRLDELETGVDETKLEDLPVRFTSSKPTQQALLFGYGINKTSVNNSINPTSGYRQYYGIEAGSESLLSDTDLAIIRAGVSGIYSFGADNKHQVLGSFNGGYIWADDFYEVPYKLRFFAGGDQSIRGYDYESLSPLENGYLTGGQVLAVGSAEYNYEFRPGFRGAVFTDVGNAYDKDFNTDTKVGVGVGIRWASPVGVVRVDVAAGVTEDSIPVRLHFFIGSPL